MCFKGYDSDDEVVRVQDKFLPMCHYCGCGLKRIICDRYHINKHYKNGKCAECSFIFARNICQQCLIVKVREALARKAYEARCKENLRQSGEEFLEDEKRYYNPEGEDQFADDQLAYEESQKRRKLSSRVLFWYEKAHIEALDELRQKSELNLEDKIQYEIDKERRLQNQRQLEEYERNIAGAMRYLNHICYEEEERLETERLAKAEAERLAKAEADRLEAERLEAERLAKAKADKPKRKRKEVEPSERKEVEPSDRELRPRPLRKPFGVLNGNRV
jgi:hypothetical protein